MSRKNLATIIFLFAIFLISIFYRIYGLSTHNPPFWVDEFASANQGKLLLNLGLKVFTDPAVYFEHYNITTHALIALSYSFFGISEFAARLPSVVIGSLVPLTVFMLTRHSFNLSTATSAALLTTFSYFEIVWSRQARGYIIVQLLILMSFFLYLRLIDEKKPNIFLFSASILVIFLGLITHPLYYIFLFSVIVHILLTNRNLIVVIIKKPWFYFFLLFFILIIYKTGFFAALGLSFSFKTFLTNNLWYYHSFLWREYGLIAFLAFIGIVIGLTKNRKPLLLLTIYLITQLFFLSFIFKPYVSRYLLPIFPFLLILTSYTLTEISSIVTYHIDNGQAKIVLTVVLTLFIIANGHKFVNKPKKYYSLNHDFREITNIDYHQIYDVIKNKAKIDNKQVVVIETWWDRARWYLKDDFKNMVAFRWLNEGGYVNGLPKKTPFVTNSKGVKFLQGSDLRLVLDQSDLLRYMKEYPVGFLFIDDSSLPKDVREYAEKNLKKELYLDHYPLDDNPYSIWPATLYSWGIK